MMNKWDNRFLEMAEFVAGWSKDPSTKVGAVIVDDKKRVISVGYNGFPRGVDDAEMRYDDRPLKYKFVCHAERNAIDNSPMKVDGCNLYCTLFPCAECAKTIIQTGIKLVITKPWLPNYDWSVDPYNWKIAQIMFDEAKVGYIVPATFS